MSDIYMFHSYDVVWAFASTIAVIMEDKRKTDLPSSDEFNKYIKEGRTPGFEASIGYHKWDKSGDPTTNALFVKLTHYSRVVGATKPSIREVALWDLANGFKLFEDIPIIWADGSLYPKVVCRKTRHVVTDAVII